MKFKVGDKVKVKAGLISGKRYGLETFSEFMEKYVGTVQSVLAEAEPGEYILSGDPERWMWTDEMLEPASEPAESRVTDESPYWANITKIAESQRTKGLRTYGHPLEEFSTPDAIERIGYIEEELIDALMYCEWLKDKLHES